MSRADSEALAMTVDGDRIIVESQSSIYTLTIGATYAPRRPNASRVFSNVEIMGAAHDDPERPGAPRLTVRRVGSRRPKPHTVWASSLVNTYDVPRVDKKQQKMRTNDMRREVENLRREVAALRALIKH